MSRLSVLSKVILLFGLSLITSLPAIAQKDYTVTPSGPIRIVSGYGAWGSEYVVVRNTSSQATTLKVRFVGEPQFQFTSLPTEYLDLQANSEVYLRVDYKSIPGDTSYAFLRVYDSVHTADTIRFIGIDTGIVGTPWIVGDGYFAFGDYYGLPDTNSISVRNLLSVPVTVSARMLPGSYGLTEVGLHSKTISVGGYGTFSYQFTGNDSALASIVIEGEGQTDTVVLRARRTNPLPSGDSLYWQREFHIGSAFRGDTTCRELTIYNRYGTAATITDTVLLQGNQTFYLSGATLPVTVPAHDSVKLNFCFIAPQNLSEHSTIRYKIVYNFAGQDPRSWQLLLSGNTIPCYAIEPSLVSFGSVKRGTASTQKVRLINYTDESITFDDSRFSDDSDPAYELVSDASFTLPAYDSSELEIRYTPTSYQAQFAYLELMTEHRCFGGYISMAGIGVDTIIIVDSTAISLFGDTTKTLSFTGASNEAQQRYRFVNDLNDSLSIVAISLKQGTHFQVYGIEPALPQFTLHSAEVMAVTLRFLGDLGTYEDTLVIMTDNFFFPAQFRIRGVIGSNNVEFTPIGRPALHISPNPATGPITLRLENGYTASLEVLDLLGTPVARLASIGLWDHRGIAAGPYFVRITGKDVLGKPFVITQRVVIE